MKKLTNAEKTFCRLYADSGDPLYAAKKANLRDPEESAAALIFREKIIAETARVLRSRRDLMRLMCENAMMKLICAPPENAMRVASGESTRYDGAELRGVSEFKYSERGSEVRFFDKVKAFEKLCDFSDGVSDGAEVGLLGAILQGAKALSGGAGDEKSEL